MRLNFDKFDVNSFDDGTNSTRLSILFKFLFVIASFHIIAAVFLSILTVFWILSA